MDCQTTVYSAITDGGGVAKIGCVEVFFFQAEDGIRDYKVTGVQTCALPIWAAEGDGGAHRAGREGRDPPAAGEANRAWHRAHSERPQAGGARRHDERGGEPGARSEERRVGKEGRSRWAPYH